MHLFRFHGLCSNKENYNQSWLSYVQLSSKNIIHIQWFRPGNDIPI